jgi:hypothetical protein
MARQTVNTKEFSCHERGGRLGWFAVPGQGVFVRSIRTVLDIFLRNRGAIEPFKLVRLWRSWPEVLGPELAELAKPLGHKDRRLILGGEDSISLQEITYFGPDILERVNGFLEGKIFDKISVELIRGRSPLDSVQIGTVPETVGLPRPEHLGDLLAIMPEDSPVTSCYRAYVRLIKGRPEEKNGTPESNREAGS